MARVNECKQIKLFRLSWTDEFRKYFLQEKTSSQKYDFFEVKNFAFGATWINYLCFSVLFFNLDCQCEEPKMIHYQMNLSLSIKHWTQKERFQEGRTRIFCKLKLFFFNDLICCQLFVWLFWFNCKKISRQKEVAESLSNKSVTNQVTRFDFVTKEKQQRQHVVQIFFCLIWMASVLVGLLHKCVQYCCAVNFFCCCFCFAFFHTKK